MDVEGLSAWIPVPMVLIAQRCVDTSRALWEQNVSMGEGYGALAPPFSRQKATPHVHHRREAYYRFPHTHRRWTVNT